MDELLSELLEISKQLDETSLGEFDFERLKKALIKLEKMAPQFCRIQKDHKIMKDYFLRQISGKLRALRIVKKGSPNFDWEDYLQGDHKMGAEKLIEMHCNLRRELNLYLGSRPHYRPVTMQANNSKGNFDYKIGG